MKLHFLHSAPALGLVLLAGCGLDIEAPPDEWVDDFSEVGDSLIAGCTFKVHAPWLVNNETDDVIASAVDQACKPTRDLMAVARLQRWDKSERVWINHPGDPSWNKSWASEGIGPDGGPWGHATLRFRNKCADGWYRVVYRAGVWHADEHTWAEVVAHGPLQSAASRAAYLTPRPDCSAP